MGISKVMTFKTSLVGGAALSLVLACAAGSAAADQPPAKHHRAHKVEKKPDAAAEATAALQAQMSEMRAQVEELKAWKDAQAANQAQTEAQVAQLKAQLAEAQAKAQAAEAKVDAQIETIPATVKADVAAAAPKTDKLYIKGVAVTLGGFVAAESIFRTKGETADMASSFSAIPFPNSTPAGHTNESRLSARQSRITLMAQGDVTQTIHLTGYGEVDFLGAAQTANSNETNSYTPRIRVLYNTIDWDTDFGGVHLLAGQNWSLATMNTVGITPRTEQPPLSIDAQYVPGFVFTRQPQVRFTVDADKTFWVAVSAENPQTTFSNNSKYLPGISLATSAAAGSGFNSANTLSLNRVPDLIGKVAVDKEIEGHKVHAEVFGIYRDFDARLDDAGVYSNESTSGGGGGGGFIVGVIPGLLDVQASGLWGKGIGRYGAGQLPDVTVSYDGTIHPINEWDLLVGGTLHLTKSLDIYAYGGEEREQAMPFTSGTIYNGLGNVNYDNTGCDTEGASNCSGNTHYVDQITAGFWHRPYVGKFGRIQWGVQYSHTERAAFDGKGAAPVTHDDMVFTSIRYYPF
jgi:multidrug efflux pump subunit AcrA (membrane-fusion protein)